MRHPTIALAALAVVFLALVAGACNRGPAEASLSAADQALAAATPEIQEYAPAELAPLTSALQGARSELARGNYTEALKAGQALPAQIQAALAVAAAQKGQLTAAWKDLSAVLPGQVQAITGKLSGLADAETLPRGLTREALVGAETDLASVTQAWAEATAAFQGGDIPRALEMAQDVKARADALAGMLGLAARPRPPPRPTDRPHAIIPESGPGPGSGP